MTVTGLAGPLITYGITQTSTGQVTEYNEERGPSANDLGSGLMDPRPFYRYVPGNAVGSKVLNFYDNVGYVDWVPTAISTNGLFLTTNATGVAGATLTLTATGAGVFSTQIIAPESGQTVTVFALGSTTVGSSLASLAYGQSGTIAAWNPQSGTGRNITISLSSNLDGGSFTILGRDMYGFKMSETIATTASSSTIKGQKAFKYISAIQASTTITSTSLTIGYGDTYGWPLKVPYTGLNTQLLILASAFGSTAAITPLSSLNTVLASTVAVQTSTTPDVRGTYVSTTASNGTVRFQMFQGTDAFQMSQITAADTSALFGATQFSSI